VSEIEKLPGALTEDISINIGQTILLYLVIAGLSFLFLAKKPKFLFVSLLSGLFLLAWFIGDNYLYTKQKEIIVYNIKGYTAINFIDGKDNILFSDLDLTENKSQLMFSIKNNWLKMGVENEKIVPLKKLNTQFMFSNIITVDNQNIFIKHNYISFYDKRILIIDENFSSSVGCPEKPLNVDYILITKNAKVNIETLNKQFHFELLIFDSTNSYWQIEKWIEECQSENIGCFDVNSNGAFSVEII
jgi:competence protein ComEC